MTDDGIIVTPMVTDHAIVLGIAGDLDMVTSPACERALTDAIAKLPPPGLVILDLRRLRFLSVAGIRLLLAFSDACADQGMRACLVLNPASHVQRAIRLIGGERLLPVFHTAGQAIRYGCS
jgi:anti-anti-sigma factor